MGDPIQESTMGDENSETRMLYAEIHKKFKADEQIELADAVATTLNLTDGEIDGPLPIQDFWEMYLDEAIRTIIFADSLIVNPVSPPAATETLPSSAANLQPQNAVSCERSGSVMENSMPTKMLYLYIHDLLVKGGMRDAAEILCKDANLQPQNAVTIDTSKGLLYDWYYILYTECNSQIAKLNSNATEDASKTKGFLFKWVPILCTGGKVLLQWFPLFQDWYLAEIANATRDSSTELNSFDGEIAKQVLWKMAFELRWLGAGKNAVTGTTLDQGNAVTNNGVPKRLSDWFFDEYSAEVEKLTDATKDESAPSKALIEELFPTFVREYSCEIANRQVSSSTKVDFDHEIAKKVVRKMASNARMSEAVK